MAEIDLTQSEADALIAMDKVWENEHDYDYPPVGGAISVPLISPDRHEQFLLDISRGRIDLSRNKYQNRARQVIVLVRLDLGGPPHRNPDDEEIPCPHLHLYREGYGDKWAMSVPSDKFSNLTDLWSTLQDFVRYCNISGPLKIQRGLFL